MSALLYLAWAESMVTLICGKETDRGHDKKMHPILGQWFTSNLSDYISCQFKFLTVDSSGRDYSGFNVAWHAGGQYPNLSVCVYNTITVSLVQHPAIVLYVIIVSSKLWLFDYTSETCGTFQFVNVVVTNNYPVLCTNAVPNTRKIGICAVGM